MWSALLAFILYVCSGTLKLIYAVVNAFMSQVEAEETEPPFGENPQRLSNQQ